MGKTISHDDYLKAKGLWLLARDARVENERYEGALARLLGVEIDSHISDSVWTDNDSLEAAMEREGIIPEAESN